MSTCFSCAFLGVLLCFMSEPAQQARSLFQQADSLQRAGKMEEAYILFQEIHLISPTSSQGREAMERIHQIEVQSRNVPKPLTIPLGVVRHDY